MEWKIWIWSGLLFFVQETGGIEKCTDTSGIYSPKTLDWDMGIRYSEKDQEVTCDIPESWINKKNLTLWVFNLTVDDMELLFAENRPLFNLSSKIIKVHFNGIAHGFQTLTGFPRNVPKYFSSVTDFEISNFAVIPEEEDELQHLTLNSLKMKCTQYQQFHVSNFTSIDITEKLILMDCLKNNSQLDQPFNNVKHLVVSPGHLDVNTIKEILSLNKFPRLKNLQLQEFLLDYNNATPESPFKMLTTMNDDIDWKANQVTTNLELKLSNKFHNYLNESECSEWHNLHNFQEPIRSLISKEEYPHALHKEHNCYLKNMLTTIAVSLPIIIAMLLLVILTFFKMKATIYTKKWFAYCPSLHKLIFQQLQNRTENQDRKPHEILLLSHKSGWCLCNNPIRDDENELIANKLTKMLKNESENVENVEPVPSPTRNFVKWSYQTSEENKILTRENDGVIGKPMREELLRLCDVSKRCVVILSRNYFHHHSREFEIIASKFDTKQLRKRHVHVQFIFTCGSELFHFNASSD